MNNVAFGSIGIEGELTAYLLGDCETGEILEGFNIDKPIEIASITKLMSYLVIMDEVTKGNILLEDRVFIDEDIASIKGSSLKVEVGEVFSIRELIEAAMVVSANDATYALAKKVAGTEEAFVKLMNNKARELNLENAIFFNCTGLPVKDLDIQNVMTTREIFILSQHIIDKYPEILEISKLPFIEMESRNYVEGNTNPLLAEIEGVDGLKTGFTNKAGYCYVSTFGVKGKEKETKDSRFIGIVMGTKGFDERKELGKTLVQYGLDNYSNRIILDEDIPLDTLIFPKGNPKEIEIYPKQGFTKLIKNDENIEVSLSLNDKLKPPIKKDRTIGKVTVYKDGEIIREEEVIVKEKVKRANPFILLGRFIENIFLKIKGIFS
nr:D-alanyl-D-alanine carboxypeptidase family protein [Tissierella simiarum]